MISQSDPTDSIELLVFELAGARYALELACVREVAPAVFITPLPDAPPVVEGVIDVRGELATVYDLRARFGLPAVPLRPDEYMLVAWTGERLVTVRCDRADWIRRVPAAALESGDQVSHGARHLSGVARLPDGLVLIHDLRRFLDEAEEDTLAAALAGHSDAAS